MKIWHEAWLAGYGIEIGMILGNGEVSKWFVWIGMIISSLLKRIILKRF
jgi:hypothetical protein